MANKQESQPQIVTLERPKHRHALLTAADGRMLGLDDNGYLALFDEAGDRVIWDRAADGVKHVATGKDVAVDIGDDVCTVSVGADEVDLQICHGPEKLPSEYLEHLRREGWVCLNSILPPELVERLQRVACTNRHEHLEQNNDIPKICPGRRRRQGDRRAGVALGASRVPAEPRYTLGPPPRFQRSET